MPQDAADQKHRRSRYPAVGTALLQTFEQYLKEDWTKEVQQAWTDTFDAIAQIMLEGADSS